MRAEDVAAAMLETYPDVCRRVWQTAAPMTDGRAA
jgi:hypothetical protein